MRLSSIAPTAATFAAILICGLAHGLMTNRWTGSEQLKVLAQSLERLPANVGPWQGEDLEIQSRHLSGLAGHIYRRYVHQQTGAAVSLFAVCGPTGPVAIHTPDVCYEASGYQVAPKTKATVTTTMGQALGEFFTSRLTMSKASDHKDLRIYWGWTAGSGWSAPENPRLLFAGQPALIKLYALRESTGQGERDAADPCLDLLREILQTLEGVAEK
jgi:hypothetical protein